MMSPCLPSLSDIRSRFPALAHTQDGRPSVFFDAPGGTQCPQSVIDAVSYYLAFDNANHGGAFATSVRSDAMIADAHAVLADFLGAASPAEIIFGPNMTSLTFSVSRAIGRELSPGDEIVVTRLDHDANVAPWLLLAEDRGATVRWVDIRPEDCTLDLDSFESQLSPRTRIVAIGYASNAVGTVNDVRRLVGLARGAGALTFVDAVQYAPHAAIDVQELGCDFLACSAYKFFGPHVGVLYGRREHLERLAAYKVRPAGNQPPDKFETGTQNHEGIAGTRAAVEYLSGLAPAGSSPATRRARIVAGMDALQHYEQALCGRLLEGLGRVPGLRIWGIADPSRLGERVPTVSFTMEGLTPRSIAAHLASAGIFVWSGHFYAVGLTARLGLDPAGGLLRVGLAHYNTAEEVDRLFDELRALPR
jgi:cysteine desulfurase family protein (TIGR01976 family)